MTPQQALELLNNVVAQVSATREQHTLFAQAIQVLTEALREEEI